MDPREKTNTPSPTETTRRDVVQKAAWIVPAVVTLSVTPSFAGQASGDCVDCNPA